MSIGDVLAGIALYSVLGLLVTAFLPKNFLTEHMGDIPAPRGVQEFALILTGVLFGVPILLWVIATTAWDDLRGLWWHITDQWLRFLDFVKPLPDDEDEA